MSKVKIKWTGLTGFTGLDQEQKPFETKRKHASASECAGFNPVNPVNPVY
jgi:hypothetical protein